MLKNNKVLVTKIRDNYCIKCGILKNEKFFVNFNTLVSYLAYWLEKKKYDEEIEIKIRKGGEVNVCKIS